MWSAFVVHMPCGKPGYTFSTALFTSLADISAEAPIGTIWSSSPWRMSVGTSNRFRSSVKSVSEKALMQSYSVAGALGTVKDRAIEACVKAFLNQKKWIENLLREYVAGRKFQLPEAARIAL